MQWAELMKSIKRIQMQGQENFFFGGGGFFVRVKHMKIRGLKRNK